MAKDRASAQACFEEKAKACLGYLKPNKDLIDKGKTDWEKCQADFKTTFGNCAKSVSFNQCAMAAHAILSSCISGKVPGLPFDALNKYQTCMTAAISGLGAFYKLAESEIYDLRYRKIDDLYRHGCNPQSDATFVCSTACQRTNSCIN